MPVSARRGWRRLAPAVLLAVVCTAAAGCTSGADAGAGGGQTSAPAAITPSETEPATFDSPNGVRAEWLIAENNRTGTTNWEITNPPATGDIEGFANATYAAAGQQVVFYVSTTAPKFHVEAYRMGYYQGLGARLIWQSAELPGVAQPACPVTAGVNMVSCDNWTASLTVPISAAFVQGDYLFKLVGANNEQSYVPLTVWDPTSHATYLFKNDVFTWQAWNPYGGYDYYQGVGSCPRNVYPLCSRSRVVSYDRPYGDENGTGDFIWLELPLVRYMEERGLDVSYVTDLTVAEHPNVLDNHTTLLSEGHDECWSLPERQAAVAAQQKGLNLAFFGASAVLRHVRSQPSPMGPDRQLVDYRDSTADPLNGTGDPLQVTGNTWASPPASWPESPFVGESYNGFLEPTITENFTVSDASAWIFAGTQLKNGDTLPNVIGSDVDSLAPVAGHPSDVQILAHSPLPANQAQANTRAGPVFYSDMTYYTDPTSHSGVWDSGTNNWIPALTNPMVQQITANLFQLFGQGPAGLTQPSTPNIGQFYPGRT